MTIARQRLGRTGERIACEHLERLGFRIVERNFRTRSGEIDVIARDRRTVVFCEVKTLRAGWGDPLASVHEAKRRQVRLIAREWLAAQGNLTGRPLFRFDAIGITLDEAGRLACLDHVEGAF